MGSRAADAQDGSSPSARDMIRRTAKAVAVFGSPIYLLPLGPFAIVGVPALTATLGREVWPQYSRRRLFAVGRPWACSSRPEDSAPVPLTGVRSPALAVAALVLPAGAFGKGNPSGQ